MSRSCLSAKRMTGPGKGSSLGTGACTPDQPVQAHTGSVLSFLPQKNFCSCFSEHNINVTLYDKGSYQDWRIHLEGPIIEPKGQGRAPQVLGPQE